MEISRLGFCGVALSAWALGVVSLLWVARAIYQRGERPRARRLKRTDLGARYPMGDVSVNQVRLARERGRRRMMAKAAERDAKRRRL